MKKNMSSIGIGLSDSGERETKPNENKIDNSIFGLVKFVRRVPKDKSSFTGRRIINGSFGFDLLQFELTSFIVGQPKKCLLR